MDLDDISTADDDQGRMLSPRQAFEAAYRFVARYYDQERTTAILRLVQSMSATGDDLDADSEGYALWQAAVQATLDGAPLPALPRPWDF
jgi:hypothetical protein